MSENKTATFIAHDATYGPRRFNVSDGLTIRTSPRSGEVEIDASCGGWVKLDERKLHQLIRVLAEALK